MLNSKFVSIKTFRLLEVLQFDNRKFESPNLNL